jgi:hypothetical protein
MAAGLLEQLQQQRLCRINLSTTVSFLHYVTRCLLGGGFVMF